MKNLELSELYKAAREAKKNDDIVTAQKLYDEINQKNPDTWEAWFYSSYFKHLNMVADAEKNTNPYMWISEFNFDEWCLPFSVCISFVPKKVKDEVSDPNEQLAIFLQQSEDLLKLAQRVVKLSLECYGRIKENDKIYNKKHLYHNLSRMAETLHLYGKKVIESFGADYNRHVAILLWIVAAEYYKNAFSFCTVNELAKARENYYTITSEIKRYVPEYQIEELPQVKVSACYIATCVYDSYDCPQVWTLRRFRDQILDTTWYGKLFIKAYYATSPTIVKWFGQTKWFKNFWKSRLDAFAKKLNEKGFADTPYTDKK